MRKIIKKIDSTKFFNFFNIRYLQIKLRAIVQSYNDAILLRFFNRKNIQIFFDDSIIFSIFASVKHKGDKRL